MDFFFRYIAIFIIFFFLYIALMELQRSYKMIQFERKNQQPRHNKKKIKRVWEPTPTDSKTQILINNSCNVTSFSESWLECQKLQAYTLFWTSPFLLGHPGAILDLVGGEAVQLVQCSRRWVRAFNAARRIFLAYVE